MRKSTLYAALAVVCLVSVLGVAGASDLYGMGIGWIVLRVGGGLVGFMLCVCLAESAAVDEARRPDKPHNRKSAPRDGSPDEAHAK